MPGDFSISQGYDKNPSRSLSLRAEAYTQSTWFNQDMRNVLAKTWQWVCHSEKTRNPGDFVTASIAGQPIAIVRGQDGLLRAFYNVCKHRAHELLQGEGSTSRIMCPYHAWVYRLDGGLVRAPHTEDLESFETADICLDAVQVEEFCGFVFVNLDPTAAALSEQSGNLETEVRHWAPDVDQLTFGHRLTYDISQMVSFVSTAQTNDVDLKIELVQTSETVADNRLAAFFEQPEGSPIIAYTRLFQTGGHPIFIETEYLLADRFPDFLQHDLRQSTTQILEKSYDTSASTGDIMIRMRGVQTDEAQLLSISASHTVIELEQVIRDAAGVPFYFGRQVWRGEMAEFSAHAIVSPQCSDEK